MESPSSLGWCRINGLQTMQVSPDAVAAQLVSSSKAQTDKNIRQQVHKELYCTLSESQLSSPLVCAILRGRGRPKELAANFAPQHLFKTDGEDSPRKVEPNP